eukprot:TRINITY_DN67918_c9_g8_i1.p1 TRINITY_DN67918_c9_g8~~TRINITY_DN67918_c9_g8_i1.p1  ORF type:complete len:280 (-),score=44.27 TRINITY_DN67918_c9_g8_i1:115-954(-)
MWLIEKLEGGALSGEVAYANMFATTTNIELIDQLLLKGWWLSTGRKLWTIHESKNSFATGTAQAGATVQDENSTEPTNLMHAKEMTTESTTTTQNSSQGVHSTGSPVLQPLQLPQAETWWSLDAEVCSLLQAHRFRNDIVAAGWMESDELGQLQASCIADKPRWGIRSHQNFPAVFRQFVGIGLWALCCWQRFSQQRLMMRTTGCDDDADGWDQASECGTVGDSDGQQRKKKRRRRVEGAEGVVGGSSVVLLPVELMGVIAGFWCTDAFSLVFLSFTKW